MITGRNIVGLSKFHFFDQNRVPVDMIRFSFERYGCQIVGKRASLILEESVVLWIGVSTGSYNWADWSLSLSGRDMLKLMQN